MNIGLIDVDGHNFPNFALMRISAYHKARGDQVEWATPFSQYDKVIASKVFTFTPDFNYLTLQAGSIEKGGTGYNIASRLPKTMEGSLLMDYSIYPQYPFSIQFFSRGCIRKCPFCLVREKEGYIQAVEPVDLNPEGKWIEVLDNNFFANPKMSELSKEIKVPLWELKEIADTLRMVANALDSPKRETCLDRNIMRSWNHVVDMINGKENSPQESIDYYMKVGQVPNINK